MKKIKNIRIEPDYIISKKEFMSKSWNVITPYNKKIRETGYEEFGSSRRRYSDISLNDIRLFLYENNLLNELQAIIFHGSAIRCPKIKNKKISYGSGFLWLETRTTTEKELVDLKYPRDLDILIVTKKNTFLTKRLNYIEPKMDDLGQSGYSSIVIKEPGKLGIDLSCRNISKLKSGVKSGLDTMSINAIKEGVVICADEKFDLKKAFGDKYIPNDKKDFLIKKREGHISIKFKKSIDDLIDFDEEDY